MKGSEDNEDLTFVTQSGSLYEINNGKIRRLNHNLGMNKRADGEWIELMELPSIVLGERAFIKMRSLYEYGPDDYGTPAEHAMHYSTRITSPVIRIY